MMLIKVNDSWYVDHATVAQIYLLDRNDKPNLFISLKNCDDEATIHALATSCRPISDIVKDINRARVLEDDEPVGRKLDI